MSFVNGIVEATDCSPFKDMFRHRINVAGIDYFAYKKSQASPAPVGSQVSLQVTNPKANTVKILGAEGNIAPVTNASVSSIVPSPQQAQQAPAQNKDVLIIRQTCIKAACEYYANRESNELSIIQLAQRLESYVTTGE